MLKRRSRLQRGPAPPEKMSLVITGGRTAGEKAGEYAQDFHRRRETDFAYDVRGASIDDFPDI